MDSRNPDFTPRGSARWKDGTGVGVVEEHGTDVLHHQEVRVRNVTERAHEPERCQHGPVVIPINERSGDLAYQEPVRCQHRPSGGIIDDQGAVFTGQQPARCQYGIGRGTIDERRTVFTYEEPLSCLGRHGVCAMEEPQPRVRWRQVTEQDVIDEQRRIIMLQEPERYQQGTCMACQHGPGVGSMEEPPKTVRWRQVTEDIIDEERRYIMSQEPERYQHGTRWGVPDVHNINYTSQDPARWQHRPGVGTIEEPPQILRWRQVTEQDVIDEERRIIRSQEQEQYLHGTGGGFQDEHNITYMSQHPAGWQHGPGVGSMEGPAQTVRLRQVTERDIIDEPRRIIRLQEPVRCQHGIGGGALNEHHITYTSQHPPRCQHGPGVGTTDESISNYTALEPVSWQRGGAVRSMDDRGTSFKFQEPPRWLERSTAISSQQPSRCQHGPGVGVTDQSIGDYTTLEPVSWQRGGAVRSMDDRGTSFKFQESPRWLERSTACTSQQPSRCQHGPGVGVTDQSIRDYTAMEPVSWQRGGAVRSMDESGRSFRFQEPGTWLERSAAYTSQQPSRCQHVPGVGVTDQSIRDYTALKPESWWQRCGDVRSGDEGATSFKFQEPATWCHSSPNGSTCVRNADGTSQGPGRCLRGTEGSTLNGGNSAYSSQSSQACWCCECGKEHEPGSCATGEQSTSSTFNETSSVQKDNGRSATNERNTVSTSHETVNGGKSENSSSLTQHEPATPQNKTGTSEVGEKSITFQEPRKEKHETSGGGGGGGGMQDQSTSFSSRRPSSQLHGTVTSEAEESSSSQDPKSEQQGPSVGSVEDQNRTFSVKRLSRHRPGSAAGTQYSPYIQKSSTRESYNRR